MWDFHQNAVCYCATSFKLWDAGAAAAYNPTTLNPLAPSPPDAQALPTPFAIQLPNAVPPGASTRLVLVYVGMTILNLIWVTSSKSRTTEMGRVSNTRLYCIKPSISITSYVYSFTIELAPPFLTYSLWNTFCSFTFYFDFYINSYCSY